jgi:hypothetical protein
MMGKDSGTYNDENGVLIEALGVSPNVCEEKSLYVPQDEKVLRTVDEDAELVGNCVFC